MCIDRLNHCSVTLKTHLDQGILIQESIYVGLSYSFKELVHDRCGRKQICMVLEK